jgi:hypothetical protein
MYSLSLTRDESSARLMCRVYQASAPGPLTASGLVLLEVLGESRRLLLAVVAKLRCGHHGRVGRLADQG